MITHTISGIELTWTIISFIGLVFQFGLFHRSMVDLIVAEHFGKDNINSLRIYAGISTVIIFLGGVITQLSYLVVGIAAMTQPQQHQHITAVNWISGLSFILASITGSLFAGIIYYRRINIVKQIESELEKAGSNND